LGFRGRARHFNIKTGEFSITKTRENGKVIYYLSNSDDNEGRKKFEAVRSDVPEEIEKVLAISDYNLQTQHDPYFLLKDSPGEVARKLNELIGLDIIDKIFKNLNSKILSTRRFIDEQKESLERLEKEIDSLAYLDSLSEQVDLLLLLAQKHEKITTSVTALQNCVKSYTEIEREEAKLERILKLQTPCEHLLKRIEEGKKLCGKLDSLNSIINQLEKVNCSMAEESEWLKVEQPEKELKKLIDSSTSIKTTIKMLSSIKEQWESFDEKSRVLSTKLVSFIASYKNILKKNKICPLCRTKINDEVIRRITL